MNSTNTHLQPNLTGSQLRRDRRLPSVTVVYDPNAHRVAEVRVFANSAEEEKEVIEVFKILLEGSEK